MAIQLVERWAESHSVGAEWEVGVVDAHTGALVPDGALRLDPRLRASPESQWIHDELFANTVEMVTPGVATVAEVVDHLTRTRLTVETAAAAEGMALSPLGSHPFSPPSTQLITPGSPRRDHRVYFHGEALTQQNIWSVHFHVGVPSGRAAIAGMRELTAHLPFFIALSASSPYWEGRDTGHESSRPGAYAGAPYCGRPPLYSTWPEYQDSFEMLTTQEFGFVRGPKDIHWEVRITHHGTVELRMCDGLATTTEIGGLAALTQCLVACGAARGAVRPEVPGEALALEGNCFLARRFGLDAELLTAGGDRRTLGQRLPDLLNDLAPWAERLECSDELAGIQQIAVRGSSARRQRAAVAVAGGRLDAAVHHAVAEMRHDRMMTPALRAVPPPLRWTRQPAAATHGNPRAAGVAARVVE